MRRQMRPSSSSWIRRKGTNIPTDDIIIEQLRMEIQDIEKDKLGVDLISEPWSVSSPPGSEQMSSNLKTRKERSEHYFPKPVNILLCLTKNKLYSCPVQQTAIQFQLHFK